MYHLIYLHNEYRIAQGKHQGQGLNQLERTTVLATVVASAVCAAILVALA